jgi:hypothetical protein
MTTNSPTGYADLASAAEQRGDWNEAAKQWGNAGRATLGFNRRSRYEAAEDRCIARAHRRIRYMADMWEVSTMRTLRAVEIDSCNIDVMAAAVDIMGHELDQNAQAQPAPGCEDTK